MSLVHPVTGTVQKQDSRFAVAGQQTHHTAVVQSESVQQLRSFIVPAITFHLPVTGEISLGTVLHIIGKRPKQLQPVKKYAVRQSLLRLRQKTVGSVRFRKDGAGRQHEKRICQMLPFIPSSLPATA